MKRVAVLMGMAAVAPSVARAQIPVNPSPPSPPAAAPTARPPAAAPGPAPAPTATPEPGGPTTDPAKAPPGDEYYVEPAPTAPDTPPAGADAEPPPFEPPPPGGMLPEPPPPPEVHHLAPRNSLWLGLRLGWFFPFGNAWAKARPVSTNAGNGYVLEGVPWRDYASSGPMFELDAGFRLSRAYTVFALWERAQLGAGDNDIDEGPQRRAETDFWAVGLRASSNPDRLGFLTEVAVGYRRARTIFENDVEYQFTDAPFEARLGLGAELRMNRLTTLSSLITVGVGGFGSVESVQPNGNAVSKIQGLDQGDGHAWVTLSIAGHVDLLPSVK